jgi:histidine ammonia-lyase
LAVPISTAFGIHEELNQDFTSHAMTSAWFTEQVMPIAKYAIATNFIAACQAIDLRGTDRLLSPMTKPLYHWLRDRVPYIKIEQPLGHYVELIADQIMSPKFQSLIVPLFNYDHQS